MICIPLMPKSTQEAISQLSTCTEFCDLIEVRLDFFESKPDIRAILDAAPKPLVITCRAQREGGEFKGDESDRIAILQSAIDLGADYVDVEYDSIDKIQKSGKSKVIASRHNFTETPSDIMRLASEIQKTDCDIVKFATMANTLKDNLVIFDTIRCLDKPAIGLCMGELGEPSRILGLRFGSLLTFGSAKAGKESAPGQPTARDLACMYRVKEISDSTKIYAVLGQPIAHSMSPAIHNAAFENLGLDCVYLKLRIDDFQRDMNEFILPMGIQGLSVTIPHKKSALDTAAEVDDFARQIGAVNTLTRTAEGWSGTNTDCHAALGAIKNAAGRIGLNMDGAPALLLGAGGTARAIAVGLKAAGCEVTIANRTIAKAESLAGEVGAEVMELSQVTRQEFSVVANTTSLGMHPNTDASAVPAEIFRPGMVAFDAVYNPLVTKMLADAKAAGAETASGLEMFVGQAAKQFEIWTGKNAPLELMEKTVRQRLSL